MSDLLPPPLPLAITSLIAEGGDAQSDVQPPQNRGVTQQESVTAAPGGSGAGETDIAPPDVSMPLGSDTPRVTSAVWVEPAALPLPQNGVSEGGSGSSPNPQRSRWNWRGIRGRNRNSSDPGNGNAHGGDDANAPADVPAVPPPYIPPVETEAPAEPAADAVGAAEQVEPGAEQSEGGEVAGTPPRAEERRRNRLERNENATYLRERGVHVLAEQNEQLTIPGHIARRIAQGHFAEGIVHSLGWDAEFAAFQAASEKTLGRRFKKEQKEGITFGTLINAVYHGDGYRAVVDERGKPYAEALEHAKSEIGQDRYKRHDLSLPRGLEMQAMYGGDLDTRFSRSLIHDRLAELCNMTDEERSQHMLDGFIIAPVHRRINGQSRRYMAIYNAQLPAAGKILIEVSYDYDVDGTPHIKKFGEPSVVVGDLRDEKAKEAYLRYGDADQVRLIYSLLRPAYTEESLREYQEMKRGIQSVPNVRMQPNVSETEYREPRQRRSDNRARSPRDTRQEDTAGVQEGDGDVAQTGGPSEIDLSAYPSEFASEIARRLADIRDQQPHLYDGVRAALARCAANGDSDRVIRFILDNPQNYSTGQAEQENQYTPPFPPVDGAGDDTVTGNSTQDTDASQSAVDPDAELIASAQGQYPPQLLADMATRLIEIRDQDTTLHTDVLARLQEEMAKGAPEYVLRMILSHPESFRIPFSTGPTDPEPPPGPVRVGNGRKRNTPK